MTYSPLLIVHILGGIVGVFSGFAALIYRKGSPHHRTAGNLFVVSMLIMGIGGALAALLKSQMVNVLAGTLTSYLVATAWLTARRREKTVGRLDLAFFAIALAIGAGGIALGRSAADHATPATGRYIFGAIALLFAASDLRMLLRGGIAGAQRLARHLWRMGLALFIATGSFFLGKASDPVMREHGLRAQLFDGIRHTHILDIPVIFVVVVTLYWLVRVRFTSRSKQPLETPLPDPQRRDSLAV